MSVCLKLSNSGTAGPPVLLNFFVRSVLVTRWFWAKKSDAGSSFFRKSGKPILIYTIFLQKSSNFHGENYRNNSAKRLYILSSEKEGQGHFQKRIRGAYNIRIIGQVSDRPLSCVFTKIRLFYVQFQFNFNLHLHCIPSLRSANA